MHLPGPIRAAVGLVATAADEVKSLPDRAVELPMLAVSTALQVSLRAQQRYAQLAARGERVLNREEPGEEPPAWATFDEPVSADELRRTALTQLDSLIDGTLAGAPDGPGSDAADSGWDTPPADSAARSAGRMFEQLFGVSDPAAGVAGPGSAPGDATDATDATDRAGAAGEPDTGAVVVPITQGAAVKRAARKSPRKSARKSPAKKAVVAKHTPAATTTEDTPPAKKSAAKSATRKAAAKKAPAKKASADPALDAGGSAGDPTPAAGKTVNKPRHTAPSKFDDVDG